MGAGFALGQLVLKNVTDGLWYVVKSSGSAPNASVYISQSALPFKSGPIYTQSPFTASIVGYMDFYEQNWPYQLVASTDKNCYAVYLVGSVPNVTFTVSQSAFGPAYITASNGAIIDLSKPGLLLQSITDGNYYNLYLSSSSGTTTAKVSTTMISQSFVHPIY